MKNDGGQAFPCNYDGPNYSQQEANAEGGMSLRDAFAIAALQGLTSALTSGQIDNIADGYLGGTKISKAAFVLADAMLAKRNKEDK